MSKRVLVHSEFGAVPSSISQPPAPPMALYRAASCTSPPAAPARVDEADLLPGGEPSLALPQSTRSSAESAMALRIAWTDVIQYSKDEEKQKTILVNKMFEPFVAQCLQSTSPAFRQTFGDGVSLVNVLCRLLCRDTRAALSQGFPECAPLAQRLLDSADHMVMLSYFSTVCDPNFFVGPVEQGNYEALVRVLALHNIPSIIAALHKAFLDLVELHKRDLSKSLTPQMGAAAQKYLALLNTLITHSYAQPLVLDLTHSNSLVFIAETLSTALLIPFWASGSLAELAASLLSSIIGNPAQRASAFPSRIVDEIERCVMDAILKEADSAHEEFGDHGMQGLKLVALHHCLLTLFLLREQFHTAVNYNFDFGLLVTVMLSLQDVMGAQRRTSDKLIDTIFRFATLPRKATDELRAAGGKQAGAAAKAGAMGLFSKLVGAVRGVVSDTSSTTNGDQRQLTAPNVAECVTLFLICSTNDDVRIQMARRYFELIQDPKAVEANFFLSTVTALAESVPTMCLLLLTEFLQVVEAAAHRHDASGVLVALARKLIDSETMSELHVIKLISFFASLGSKSPTAGKAVVRSGVIMNTTRLLQRFDSFEHSTDLLRNLLRLWGTLTRVTGSIAVFEEAKSAEVALEALLSAATSAASEVPRPPSPSRSVSPGSSGDAVRSGSRFTLVALCRELFGTMVEAKRDSVTAVVDHLLRHSGKAKWDNRVSALLCALCVCLQKYRCAEDAIRANGIEVCLSLLQAVEGSNRLREETTLVATCLSLMFPLVRFSEVKRLLAVSIPTSLRGSTAMCQFLADLTTGCCRSGTHIDEMVEWYDSEAYVITRRLREEHHSDPASSSLNRRPSFSREGRTIADGLFVVPVQPQYFCEFTFPLLELCRWYHEALLSTLSSRENSLVHHTTKQLAALVLALSVRLRSPIKDAEFAHFVMSQKQYNLLHHVADVCITPELTKRFFLDEAATADWSQGQAGAAASPAAKQPPFPLAPQANVKNLVDSLEDVIELWEAAVVPRGELLMHSSSLSNRSAESFTSESPPHDELRDSTRTDFPHSIEFFGQGGAFGTVDHVGDEGWPSPDGYAVAMWCYWSNVDGSVETMGTSNLSKSSSSVRLTTGGSANSLLGLDDESRSLDKGYVPLWAIEWLTTDPSASACSIQLRINLNTNFTVLNIHFNGFTSFIDLPLIPQNTWTHVVVSHQRNKLFPSEVSVYMDGGLAKRSTMTYPLAVIAQASGFSPCKSLGCVLGFDKKESNNAHHLRIGPFVLYNTPVTKEVVLSIFGSPSQSLHVGYWGAMGDAAVSATAVVLDRPSLNYLLGASANDSMDTVMEKEKLEFFTPPQKQLLVALHPASASLVPASFRYLDNHDWSLTNTVAPSEAAAFVLQGPHSEPTMEYNDPAHALVANGGTTEWLRWLHILTTLATEASLSSDSAEDIAARERIGLLGRKAMLIIASCTARVPVKELRHRAFYYNLTVLIMKQPRLVLGSVDAIRSIMSLFCTFLYVDGAAIGAKDLYHCAVEGSVPSAATGTLLPVLSNAATSEMLFCQVEVWSHLPVGVAAEILLCLNRMLQPSNRFARLNALRLKSCGFINGFVYGLIRQFVPCTILFSALEVVTLFVRTSLSDHGVLSEMLTFIAASIPTDGDDRETSRRLGSKLYMAAPEYASLVRNLVLRIFCELLTTLPPKSAAVLTESLGDVIPLSWVYVVTNRFAHPVTVSLSLQIVCHLLMHHNSFKSRSEKGNLLRTLLHNVTHHSHQPDITSLLMHAFLGHPRNVLVYQQHLMEDGAKPTERAVPYLLYLLMHLQKSNAIGARDPAQIAHATRFYEQIPATAYFSQIGRQVSNFDLRLARRRLCAVIVAVRAAIRLRSVCRLKECPTTATVDITAQSARLRDECVRRKDLVVRVLNWVAVNFLTHEYVSVIMFNPTVGTASTSNSATGTGGAVGSGPLAPSVALAQQLYGSTHPIDCVAWILVCALGNMDDLANSQRGSTGDAAASLYGGDENSDSDDGATPEELLSKTVCQSYGLDQLPSPAHDAMFQACCNVYVGLIEQQIRDYVALYVGKQNIKTSPYALVLHHILSTCPQGIGDHAEAWFYAAVISLWLQTTARSLQRHTLNGDKGHFLSKNCVSLAQYVTERLCCGLPTPPNGVMSFLVTLLGTLQYAEHLKQVRHCVLEWMCFVSSPEFHGGIAARAQGAKDLIYAHRAVLFGQQIMTFPANNVDTQRYMLVKLLELSGYVVTDYASSQTPHAHRMAELWVTVLGAHKGSPTMSFILAEGAGNIKGSAAGHVDFLHGGFDILNQKIGGLEMFLSWYADQRYAIQDYVKAHAPLQQYHKPKIANTGGFSIQPKRHLKWAVKSAHEYSSAKAKVEIRGEETLRTILQSWERFRNTSTFVDPNLLKQREFARLDVLVVREPSSSLDEVGISSVHKKYMKSVPGSRWYPSEAHAQSRRVELGGEPIGVYLSSPPSMLIPMIAGVIADAPTANGNLKANAAALVDRILHGGSIQPKDTRVLWIGNVYHLIGTESIVCTMILVKRELVLVSHSQITPAGDFFVTQIRRHAAAEKSQKRRMPDAISRFLPAAPSFLVNATGGLTTSITNSAYRHSQYYRQLRTEALEKDTAAFVWRFPVQAIQCVHHRRFQHQPCAIEFTLENGTSYFTAILDNDMAMSKGSREAFVAALQPLLGQGCVVDSNRVKKARMQAVQRRWIRGQVSNMEYLMTLNDCASRTVSDLTQYPVVPWVLREYVAPTIDLQDTRVYRDLTKPMGALHPTNAANVHVRYTEWPDESQPPFHYGTHYSTSAVTLYYLVRLQPYTQLSIRYQGGRLDVADRLFHSVAEAWNSSSGVGSDVKELIPEMYTSGVWAKNHNQVNLGCRRDGVQLNDAILPPWARGSPEIFANVMTEALESGIVSENLNHWIDLVFGVKQRGDEAVRALNVFHHLSYDDGLERAMSAASNEEDRKAIAASVDNFGLTPKQLFTAPHPKRQTSGNTSKQVQFLNSVGQLAKRPNMATTYPHPLCQTQKVASIRLIESMLYCSTSTHKFTIMKPILHAALDMFTGCITVAPHMKDNVAPRVLPAVHSFGCGWVTTFCLSANGNIVACGTEGGSVLLFSRSTAESAYSLSNILAPPAAQAMQLDQSMSSPERAARAASTSPHRLTLQELNGPKRVRLLSMWNDGQLIVSSEQPHLAAWHVTHTSAMFCFSVPLCGSDRSPVKSVCRQENLRNYIASRDHSIVMFNNCGVVLAYVDLLSEGIMASMMTQGSPQSLRSSGAQASAVSAASTLHEPITTVSVMEFPTHSTTNIAVCGHKDGSITFWSVRTVLGDESDCVREVTFHSSIVVDKGSAITALALLSDMSAVVVASGGEGTLTTLAVPLKEVDMTDGSP